MQDTPRVSSRSDEVRRSCSSECNQCQWLATTWRGKCSCLMCWGLQAGRLLAIEPTQHHHITAHLAEDTQLLGVGQSKVTGGRGAGQLLLAMRLQAPRVGHSRQLFEVGGQAFTHDGHQLGVDLCAVYSQVLQEAVEHWPLGAADCEWDLCAVDRQVLRQAHDGTQ